MEEFAKGAVLPFEDETPVPDAILPPAAAVSMNPALEPLDKKISKYIGGNPIRIDGSPKASGILETVSFALRLWFFPLTPCAVDSRRNSEWCQSSKRVLGPCCHGPHREMIPSLSVNAFTNAWERL